MADAQHLARIQDVLKSGQVQAWNDWRGQKAEVHEVHGYRSLVAVDLSNADLRGPWSFGHLDLADVDFRNARLDDGHLHSANLRRAGLAGASLVRADLRRAVLDGADLSGADLRHANLGAASLVQVNLGGADLSGAGLFGTRLQRCRLIDANLSGCEVYGVSTWDLDLDGATQRDLVITPPGGATIAVDDLEVAQFVYLLISKQAIRRVIDSISAKAVLILGRFTPKRKPVLDALRQALRGQGYLPILFDFDNSPGKTLTETMSTLAHLSRFIIADITSAKSVPQELASIVPHLPTVPVQPILAHQAGAYAMFEHFQHYPWVLPIYRYQGQADLLNSLMDKVIAPAEAKAAQLRGP